MKSFARWARAAWARSIARRTARSIATPFDERSGSFSPDGKWVAYTSNESGRYEVYVRAYPGPGARLMVSTSGGVEPRWSPKGDELFYRVGTRMMVAAVSLAPEFSIDTPRLLFDQAYLSQGIVWNYDVFPDGEHFIMIVGEINPPIREIRVVLNWTTELATVLSDN